MIHIAKTLWDEASQKTHIEVSFAGGALKDLNRELKLNIDEHEGTTPEEFLAAGLSSSYTAALIKELEKKGYRVQQLATEVEVHTNDKREGAIARIDICTEAMIPGITFADFLQNAEHALEKCTVTKALEAVEILLHPTLKMGMLSEIMI